VDGEPDQICLIGHGPVDCLADPPHRVGRELGATPPVEFLAGSDQADRALLDEVEQWESVTLVALGDRDDQAKVRVDHPLLRLRVAALDSLRELYLLRRREESVPAYLLQVQLEAVGKTFVRGHGATVGAAAGSSPDDRSSPSAPTAATSPSCARLTSSPSRTGRRGMPSTYLNPGSAVVEIPPLFEPHPGSKPKDRRTPGPAFLLGSQIRSGSSLRLTCMTRVRARERPTEQATNLCRICASRGGRRRLRCAAAPCGSGGLLFRSGRCSITDEAARVVVASA
jgi:hypothetical protein